MSNIITRTFNRLTGRAKPVRSERFHRVRAQLDREYNRITAKYESAAHTDENSKHYRNADHLSAKLANSHEVRSTVRSRARLEYDNSSHCKGMVLTYANEIVGTGPRLQLQTSNEKANQQIERLFGNWCEAVALSDKLQLAFKERLVSGELFFLKTTNPAVEDDVLLDLRPIETDQVTTPYPNFSDPRAVDGVRFDSWGNPASYDILKHHPGGEGEFGAAYWNYSVDVVSAAHVLHWFRVERPGQARGMPDMTPAIPIFNQERRYTQAVLSAAELAACFAGIIKTAYPPGSDAHNDPEPWELIDIVKGMLQTLPLGSDISQMKAEQPVTGYKEFIDCILKEACRCLEMPFSIATGDSSDSSYASGRLEVQSWERKVRFERNRVQRILLNPIFTAWLQEASLIDGYLPLADLGPPRLWRRAWMWDGFGHVDPQKRANANDVALKNGSMTLEDIYSAEGKDWQEALRQLGREFDLCEQLGFAHPIAQKPQTSPAAPIPVDAPAKTSDQRKGVANAAVA